MAVRKKAIYIAQDQFGRLKIGMSSNPEGRVRDIFGQAGLEIRRMYYSDNVKDYTTHEYYMHSKFKDHRLHGEWFKCDFDDAVLFLKNLDKVVKKDKRDTDKLIESLFKKPKLTKSQSKIHSLFYDEFERMKDEIEKLIDSVDNGKNSYRDVIVSMRYKIADRKDYHYQRRGV